MGKEASMSNISLEPVNVKGRVRMVPWKGPAKSPTQRSSGSVARAIGSVFLSPNLLVR